MRGDTDGEATDGAGEMHELGGIGELARSGVGVLRRVAAERHEVLDARLAERDKDVGQFQARMGHADQVRHRVEPCGVQHPGDDVKGALA